MGRKKLWKEQLRLAVAEGVTARMDALLRPDEARLDFIREAIEREIERRRPQGPKRKTPEATD